jgi:hypothetical protein
MGEAPVRAAALDRAEWVLGLANPLWATAEITVVAPADRRLLAALVPFLRRAMARGARPGRLTLLLAQAATPTSRAAELATRRMFPELRVHTHHPERATWFTLKIDDLAIDLDDVLRESELMVLAGLVSGPGDERALTRLLIPGLASPGVRARWSRDPERAAVAARVASALAIDFVIAFDANDPGRVYVGPLAGMDDASAWS